MCFRNVISQLSNANQIKHLTKVEIYTLKIPPRTLGTHLRQEHREGVN
jgi:hypothetical protein